MSQLVIVAFSFQPIFQVRLSTADSQNQTLVHLTVHIRDRLECRAEVNLSSILIITNQSAMMNFVDHLQNSTAADPFILLLASGNQNVVGQLLTSVSQFFNRLNNDQLDEARASQSSMTMMIINLKDSSLSLLDGIAPTSISISSLSASSNPQVCSVLFSSPSQLSQRFSCRMDRVLINQHQL